MNLYRLTVAAWLVGLAQHSWRLNCIDILEPENTFLLMDVHTEIYFEEVDIIMGEKSGVYRDPFSLSWQRLNLKKKRKR